MNRGTGWPKDSKRFMDGKKGSTLLPASSAWLTVRGHRTVSHADEAGRRVEPFFPSMNRFESLGHPVPLFIHSAQPAANLAAIRTRGPYETISHRFEAFMDWISSLVP